MSTLVEINKGHRQFFYAVAVLLLLSMVGFLVYDTVLPLAIPAAVILGLAVVSDIRLVYYSFFALLPFSIEYEIGSFGTDLPTEPMMLLLTLIGVVIYTNKNAVRHHAVKHPITLLLVLNLAWIFITALFSQNFILSIKYFIAKSWYVIPFYFLTFHFFQDDTIRKRSFKILTYSLLLAVCIVLVRHAQVGFAFSEYNRVVSPIFRNHVTYASMIVVVMPFIWALLRSSTSSGTKWFYGFVLLIMVIGTNFSYTRAAQGCILLMVIAYYILHYRLTIYALALTTVAVLSLSLFLVTNNKFMDFAPNYQRTITHHSYDNLVEATVKLEDISTMERVYRWVAAGYMVGERPLLGYGPSTFYSEYHRQTIKAFKTYVSDNPEKSGIHNYYLMILVERGIIGLLIYVAFIFFVLLRGEEVYHRYRNDPRSYYIAAAWLSIVTLCILNTMNDLVEVDKIGPIYFISIAMIVHFDKRREEKMDNL